MTSAEFSDLLAKLGLSQVSGARWLGVGDRTVRRWVFKGDVPDAVVMLLKLMISERISPLEAREIAGLDLYPTPGAEP